MKAFVRRFTAFCLVAMLSSTLAARAQSADKDLQRVRGSVGYKTGANGDFVAVPGQLLLPDDDYAVTRASSNGLLVLPDSSQVALGANTSIQVGKFNGATAATPTTLLLENGAIRFSVQHPTGGQANYRFSTVTSQLAVRGTVGLIQTSATNGDIISCLECGPNDAVATIIATGQQIPLLTGQTLFVSLAGVVTIAATSTAMLSGFSGTGLSTSATSTTAFAPGIGSATAGASGAAAAGAAPAMSGASAGAIGAAAAVGAAGIAAGVSASSSSSHPSSPATPVASPTNIPGSATLQGAPAQQKLPGRK